ncbi:inactive protein kinase [Dorcoceras hygrometricum]|uniref:Inactive protein kinase n=1 Tax=Dorcoceras hygrometricum TaxID=472368 RepID=A0A2Z7CVB0_9LAMI|nr:inactive protein kinase [Dorcoceras hygrometricum]
MSSNIQKIVIIQDASKELRIIRHVLGGLELKSGDKVELLGIIQAFRDDSAMHPTLCGALLQNKSSRLHSSATINKHRQDIGEEIQKKIDQYTSCNEHEQILRMAESLQIEFKIEVIGGLLKKVAVEYVKSVQATHVVLHRNLKKEWNYFARNLSCGISRMKSDDTIKVIRQPQETEGSALLLGQMQESTSNPESRNLCSLCMNRNPLNGIKKRFTYAELQLATNGFCSENLFSNNGRKIYLGVLNDQSKVLIREQHSATIKHPEFNAEVQTLHDIRHENVTLFLGLCTEGPKRLLVYEYVCNGSLNKHLSEKNTKLTWEKRLNIALGAAEGLQVLNSARIYGSMRPSNILITHDYQPLISFYGLTINQYESLGQSSETAVLKTFEFLAPEYQETGVDLSKADVFSFGVVLLELLTGRKTIEDTNGQTFLRWARPLLKKKKYMELIDPMLQDSVDLYQLYWLIRVAEKCLNWDPKSRYSIRKVVMAMRDVINRCSVEDFSPTESELMAR